MLVMLLLIWEAIALAKKLTESIILRLLIDLHTIDGFFRTVLNVIIVHISGRSHAFFLL